jgi:hypothetical protein
MRRHIAHPACATDLYSRAQLLWQVNIVEVIIRYTAITARDIPFCVRNCTDVQLNLALVSPVKLLYVGVQANVELPVDDWSTGIQFGMMFCCSTL